jgi:hypothetical protein
MATITKDQIDDFMKKTAAGKKLLGPFLALPKDVLMMYLTGAAALGLAGGAGAGIASSYIKSRNPKLTALSRKKDFYDKKVEEMDNENWLNDLMAAKKKLETSRLTDDERTALEQKYMEMLDK